MATPSFARSWRNFRKLGLQGYFRQMLYIGDPKAGTLVGTDQHGNRFYEDHSEIYSRERWVDYAAHDYNASQVDPEWHSWLQHIRHDPPPVDPIIQQSRQAWQLPHKENLTGTRGAFRTYSTTEPKVKAWQPHVAERKG